MGLFVIGLVGKDVTGAPFPNVIRVVVQLGCLIAGLIWIVSNWSHIRFGRYWPIFCYLLALLCSALASEHAEFALLEVLSLGSGILLFVGYFEERRALEKLNPSEFTMIVIVVYTAVVFYSLLILLVRPDIGYETLYAGDAIGDEFRFRGAMSKSSHLGATAGLLLGLAAIALRRSPRKMVVCLAALLVMVLTQSRTYWIAGAVGGFVTMFFYDRRRLVWVGVLFLLGLGALGIATMSGSANVFVARLQGFARIHNIENLNGRVNLWDDVAVGLKEKPLLGYGFTLGSLGLAANHVDQEKELDIETLASLSRQTTHNGFLQSLLDAGVIGSAFYVLCILVAFWRILTRDLHGEFPEALFVLAFLAIANMAESVIYSGSVFDSLMFWIFAVFSMALERPTVSASFGVNASRSSCDGKPMFSNLLR